MVKLSSKKTRKLHKNVTTVTKTEIAPRKMARGKKNKKICKYAVL